MKKTEIERKFAEIEKFMDTPVKRYSSGMYVSPWQCTGVACPTSERGNKD